jgi:hypothetical protein
LGGGQAQRVVLFFQVTRQQSGGDDREHQARVHAVVELLDQGGQHDAAQDRTVDVLGPPDAREHAQEEQDEQENADEAVGEEDGPELALGTQSRQPGRRRGARSTKSQERRFGKLVESFQVVRRTVCG